MSQYLLQKLNTVYLQSFYVSPSDMFQPFLRQHIPDINRHFFPELHQHLQKGILFIYSTDLPLQQ